jgi:hypothetical protein
VLIIGDGSFGFVRSVLDEILTPRPLHHSQQPAAPHTGMMMHGQPQTPAPSSGGGSQGQLAAAAPKVMDYMDFM